ncbi:MAG TPA: LLM class F420-dependent oxidoreductase, partial [Candidatus Limnocylindrales bacterium]|nr:LLM class F420-dependent oxidoreductase [Candidatus Limnocylindrales bacterium]
PQGWILDLVDIEDPVEQFETMVRVTRRAEGLGFDSVWLFDHFHTYHRPVLETTFEAWTSTAALARETSRIRIGQMVTANSYRNPALLAKMASTVDVMSRGRLDFGIGAGWYEHEYRAYGYDFTPVGTRLRMLDEALQVFHAMWREPYASFAGEFYRIEGAINEPKGVQAPHPPIWVGGSGERVTLRLAAQYADATNFGGHLDDMGWFRHKFDVVRRHCEAIGRDPDDLIRSANVETTLLRGTDDPEIVTRRYRRDESLEEYRRHAVVGGPQEVIDTYGRLVDAGVDYIIVADVPGLATGDVVDAIAADVLPAFEALRAG